MAEAKTAKKTEIKDIPKPEWECYTCGSDIIDCVFNKKTWNWRIVRTYHYTGFWRQDNGAEGKRWVHVGKICPEAKDIYCKECGAIPPMHYPMCPRLSEDTKRRYKLIRQKSETRRKQYEFKGVEDLAKNKTIGAA